MNPSIFFFFLFLLFACSLSQHSVRATSPLKIPCYVWTRGFHNPSENDINIKFYDLKNKGIKGVIYSAGNQLSRYERAAKIAKVNGLEFYALLPALIQGKHTHLEKYVYMVNGLGESTYNKPAYPNNHFVCPNRPEVGEYLEELYGKIAAIPQVDGIQLDVIRFPDVILAPALWKKYNVVMDKEYSKYDYCYCDKCVADFEEKTGINIKKIKEPAAIEAWKQFRYDLLTKLVSRLAKMVHNKNKKINAAVFPGPHSFAKKLVRQEWNKWDIDAFFPMNYNDFYLKGTNWIGQMCREEVIATLQKKPIYSGLFICTNWENKAKETDPENFGLLPHELGMAINASIKNGATGICLFTSGRMTKEHWEVFEQVINNKND